MCVPQNILCPPKIFASPFLGRYFKDNLLTKNSSRFCSSPADWVSGGAYWRITVKERVIYLGNFSQTIFGRCSAGEDAIYIYIAPLLIHFAGLPILSNLVALSVSHTRFHLTGLSSNRFKSAFASVIPYRPPLSSLSPRVEKDF